MSKKKNINPYILIFALLTAEILSAFEMAMLYPALKVMIKDFESIELVGWVMSSYLLSSAVFAAICGRLGDIFGRRQVMLIVIILSILGSIISGFSNTIEWLLLGRVIQGSAGAIFPLCIGLVRENVKSESVPILIGTLAATLTVTMGLGTFIGGVIVDNAGWQWIFFGGAIAGVIAFLAIFYLLPSSSSPKNAFDKRTNIAGGILFAPAIVFLLLGISKAPSWGWFDINTITCVITGCILLAVWIQSELKAKTPLLDVRLLANRQVLLVNIGSIILGMTSFQSMQLWSIVMQQPTSTGIGLGATATLTGLALLPKTLIALVAGPLAGWLVAKYNGRTAMSFGSFLMACMWGALVFYHDNLLTISLLLTALGLGMSTFYASIPILIAQAVPMNRTSEASGMMIVIRSTAMGIGAQIVATLMNSSSITVDGTNYPDETALELVLLYVIAGSLLQLIVAQFLNKNIANS